MLLFYPEKLKAKITPCKQEERKNVLVRIQIDERVNTHAKEKK